MPEKLQDQKEVQFNNSDTKLHLILNFFIVGSPADVIAPTIHKSQPEHSVFVVSPIVL